MFTDKVHKHMVDIKMYVDNSTKMIIDEIRLSRVEQIPEEQPEVYLLCYFYFLFFGYKKKYIYVYELCMINCMRCVRFTV